MLGIRAVRLPSAACRRYTTACNVRPVPILASNDIETFRKLAFKAEQPALLPRGSFNALPAIERWFEISADATSLNHSYLAKFGSTAVPLEISSIDQFARNEQTLAFFLDASTLTPPTARVYLAQASTPDLPKGLRDDVPTPEVVLKAGKGDVYDSSIWLGNAPTYTPLHRDPNPNLFVQLAGRKAVRLYRPDIGRAIFAKVQERIGGAAQESMRGEEMMQGMEKKALEHEVWTDDGDGEFSASAWEAELSSGDGLFIPKGWWHSVKSVGEGMTGSVNWWFR